MMAGEDGPVVPRYEEGGAISPLDDRSPGKLFISSSKQSCQVQWRDGFGPLGGSFGVWGLLRLAVPVANYHCTKKQETFNCSDKW